MAANGAPHRGVIDDDTLGAAIGWRPATCGITKAGGEVCCLRLPCRICKKMYICARLAYRLTAMIITWQPKVIGKIIHGLCLFAADTVNEHKLTNSAQLQSRQN